MRGCIASSLIALSAISIAQDTSTQQPASSQEESRWRINFKDSDIHEVIKFVADVTGKTVIIDPRVKGKVKVISDSLLTKQQLYDLFLSVLETQNFTAIEVGNVVRIIPRKDARTSAVPVTSQPDLGTDAYITQVIQLYNVSATKILPVLRPLAPQHSHLAAYQPSNAIIVSDTVANIARLKDIIQQLDRAGVAETEVIPLKYARAADVVTILQQHNKNIKDSPQNTQTIIVADQRSNSILVTGDEVRRHKSRDLVKRLDIYQPQLGKVYVKYLKYADAEEVAAVLTKVVSSLSKLEPDAAKKSAQPSADSASVEADPATNSLLITADTETMESLLPVIDRLDIRRAQVLVEAIIVELTSEFNKEFGVEWAAYKDGKLAAVSQNGGGLSSTALAIKDNKFPSIGDGQTLGFFLGSKNKGVSFAGLIRFFQKNSDVNILSTPSVLTTDNAEASISIGQEIPVVTGDRTSATSNNSDVFRTFERQKVGISLKVTPQINGSGDTLILELAQEVSSVAASAENTDQTTTNNRNISTKVIAEDGELIILGGLKSDDVQEVEHKVPLLGDIPIVGSLFRHDQTTTEERNLMVFLRASIIKDNRDMQGATREKYNSVREDQQRARQKPGRLTDRDVLPLLPAWEEFHDSSPDTGGTTVIE
ncbi:type II secretion system protein GspD [Candidatus Endobugula sertula]|uniref:Type II secretion system protein GspD n=1 Tax=Candidatus Endobugula sertula TaxID=62101 RepID=A0A1D2QSK8_9GAMM|nr:type II secretion system protein GspD [Candidatus Endobugula sertula]